MMTDWDYKPDIGSRRDRIEGRVQLVGQHWAISPVGGRNSLNLYLDHRQQSVGHSVYQRTK